MSWKILCWSYLSRIEELEVEAIRSLLCQILIKKITKRVSLSPFGASQVKGNLKANVLPKVGMLVYFAHKITQHMYILSIPVVSSKASTQSSGRDKGDGRGV